MTKTINKGQSVEEILAALEDNQTKFLALMKEPQIEKAYQAVDVEFPFN